MNYICITWASSGIWEALARKYFEDWKSLILTARNDVQQKELEKKIWNSNVEFFLVDFAFSEQIENFSLFLQGKTLEKMIFCAWSWTYSHFWNISIAEIQSQFQVNTLAPLLILHKNIKDFHNNDTKLVFFSSVIADFQAKKMSVYSASKRALQHSLKIIGWEYPKLQILILHLWAVQTPMHLKVGMEKMQWKTIQKVLPSIIESIEKKHWSSYLFFDWWLAWNIVAPLHSLFLTLKKIWKKQS